MKTYWKIVSEIGGIAVTIFLFVTIFILACVTFESCSKDYPKFKVGECYSDGINNYQRIIKINNQYKSAWYYQLYVDRKDVGEFHGSIDEIETMFEFKGNCP